MDAQRQAVRVVEVFEAVVEMDPTLRDAYLADACDGAPDLRREVEALLALHDDGNTDVGLFPPLFAATPSLVGQRIGPYLVREHLSEGGMGVVYLAEREDLGKTVAIKLVREGRLAAAPQMQRFLRERRVLARMEHPNIARLLDAGWTEQRVPYLVMEYVDGIPLTAYCDEQRLSIEARLQLFLDVCDAVAYAHRSRIVHRDLKPSNVLVTVDGDVKLLDFGIAKLFADAPGEATGLTRTGMVLATPEYASPEQIRGLAITPASDVYSLGVMLYELLSGHRPYRLASRSAAEIERVVCGAEPERPSTMVGRPSSVARADGTSRRHTPDDVSGARGTRPERLRRQLRGDLDSVVMTAIAKDPDRRYASVDALRDELDRYLRGLPVRARGESPADSARRFARRAARELSVPAWLLLAVVLTLGGAVAAGLADVPAWALAAGVGAAALGLPLAWMLLVLRAGPVARQRRGQAAPHSAGSNRPGPEGGDAHTTEPVQPFRSIAVLPFADIGAGGDDEHLADGVTEELMNVLAHVPGLHVPARTSSFAFKGRNVDVREIGRKLGVEAVLAGSLRGDEREIVVTAQLVNVEDGYQLWAEKYRRPRADLLALQEEISRAIVGDLRLRFDGGNYAVRIAPSAGDPEAYNLYLKGRHLLHQGSGDSLRRALAYFEQAIQRDDAYAAAHAGAGDVYMNLGYFGHLPRAEAYPLARRAVARALELDPALAEAHSAHAWIALRADWDFPTAERAYRRALALKPSYASAHQGYALFLAYQARLDEALRHARRAVELDPLSVPASNALGTILLYAGDLEAGVRQYRASLDLDPERALLLCNLALACSYAGNHEEAVALARRACERSRENVWALGALCYSQVAAGQLADAAGLLRRLEDEARHGRISPCFVAVVCVGLRRFDEAFEWLELACTRKDDLLLVLEVDPLYAPLHGDRRYASLLRRVGLAS